jgi:poly-gamma-glutamate synthesis protein (capsule biosynthesis protein)
MKTSLSALALLLALCGAIFLYGPKNNSVAESGANIEISSKPLVPSIFPAPAATAARIFAGGDMIFDRKIRIVSQENGPDYPFSCIDPLLRSADFAVANLEGPITANASKSVGSAPGSYDNYFFTFPTTTGELLSRHNFRAVGIGNNHILNFGYAGLLSTQENLSQAGVGFFGGVDGNEGIFETEQNGVPLAFVGYNEFGGGSVAEVANNIKKEHDAGRVVLVYAHWGDEYVDASPRLRPVAELFAQAGASAIIGMHPHVVLPHEYIGDTLVYYSLGNFIFDQYFSDDVDHGLTLILTVTKDGKVTAAEHPVTINRNGTTCETVQ